VTSWNSTAPWPYFIPRSGILTLNNRLIAVGFHLFPHGSIQGGANPGLPGGQSDVPPTEGRWPLGGHMCMYYGNSTSSFQATMTAMNRAAEESYERH
jgi:hypothetical protein